MKNFTKLATIFVLAAGGLAMAPSAVARDFPPDDAAKRNWTGDHAVCGNRDEFRKTTHMDIGVRFDTADPHLIAQTRRALDFWATVVDMEWHEDETENCTLAISDNRPDALPFGVFVVTQLLDWSGFEGQMAFDSRILSSFSDDRLYATIVHEFGHILRLKHNSNMFSVMNNDERGFMQKLDAADIAALKIWHALRRDEETIVIVAAQTPEL